MLQAGQGRGEPGTRDCGERRAVVLPLRRFDPGLLADV